MTKQSIKITKDEQVTSTSTGTGSVTATTWNPNFGYITRKQEIEEARAQALKEHHERQVAADPLLQRVETLEHEMAYLKKQLVSMDELVGKQ